MPTPSAQPPRPPGRGSRGLAASAAFAVLTTSAAFAAGCAPAEQAAHGAASVRDSAGVRIVENPGAGDHSGPWTVADEPEWRVGWGADEPAFERIQQGVLLSDGTAVAADGGSATLHYLGPDGRVVATVGGEGEGPGEFSQLTTVVALPGDSVLGTGWDMRANVFGPTGELGRTARLAPAERSQYVLAPASVTPDGRLLMTTRAWSPDPRGSAGWLEAPVVVRGWDTDTPHDTVGWLGLGVNFIGPEGRPVGRSTGEYGVVATVPDGFVWGGTPDPEVRWYDYRGTLTQVARWNPERIAIDDAWWDAHVERRLAMVGESPESSGPMLDRYRTMLEAERSVAEVVPVFSRLLADDDGNVWLGDWTPDRSPPTRYVVFAPDGTLMGQVELPDGCLALAIASERILCQETDAYDVPAVALYRMEGRTEG